MLINLSNHPYKNWSNSQKEAASVYGKCVDLPFPRVKATDDDVSVKLLGECYFNKIRALSVDGEEITVHLMGEMTFTCYLVSLLHSKGINSVASTSERIVHEVAPGKKEVKFCFSRFRRYIQ